MAFQETSRQSYGNKVKNSFQGILWGIILIIAGTVVLWWNEGRAVKASDALKDFEKNYVELSDINTIDPEFEGKAVHATGIAVTADTLRDNTFGIAVNAMKLTRRVEYYQWVQKSSSESKDKIGGSTETTTTYTYEPAWCDSPVNSNEFKDPDYKGKNFVLRAVDNLEQTAANVSFGAYRLSPGIIARISGDEPVNPSLTEAQQKQLLTNVSDSTVVVTVSGGQVYIGSDPAAPRIGDVRITFTQVTSPKTISLLQKVVNGTFENYVAKNGRQFSKVEMGTVSAANMIENQKTANKTWLWIFRIIGIILVLVGNRSLLSFISTVFAVVPFVQRIIGTGTNLVAGLVGIIWSLIVIAVAWVAHRPFLAIVLLLLAAALIVWLVSRGRKKKANQAAALLLLCLVPGILTGCTKGNGIPDNGKDGVPAYIANLKGPVKTVTVDVANFEEGYSTLYEFDLKGNLLSEQDESFDYEGEEGEVLEQFSEKDAQGRYTKEVWGVDNEPSYIYTYEYDNAGHIVYTTFSQCDGSYQSSTRYVFDDQGRTILTSTASDTGEYSTSYEYDDKGNMFRRTYSTNGIVNSIATYRFDEDGNEIYGEDVSPGSDHKSMYWSSYDKDGEIIGTTSASEDGGVVKIHRRDTTFTDKNGLRHERCYLNYDDEYAYESTYNKQGIVTHYEFFEGNGKSPSTIVDFRLAPDGVTVREVTWKDLVLGQVKNTFTRTLTDNEDTFGNWTRRTEGLTYNFDIQYMKFEDLLENLCTTCRKITYFGDDQGQNYGYRGKAGNADFQLTYTADQDIFFGEMTVDGNVYRSVGTRDRDGNCRFVALLEEGEIPWSLEFREGSGKPDATLYKGENAIQMSLNPTRDGVKTYSFAAEPHDVVGLYRYEYPDGLGSGTLNVYRCGTDWSDLTIEVNNIGRNAAGSAAQDEFTDSLTDDTLYYRYAWDDSKEEGLTYAVYFYDTFAVIRVIRGDAAFFAPGSTIEAVYAKLPSVG